MSGLTRPLTRPLTSPLARAVGEGGGGFSVGSLFAASEQGAWYDPSDLSTLFQDAAGSIPVTAVEQPVGLMLDKRLGLARGSVVASTNVRAFFTSGGAVDTPINHGDGTYTVASGSTLRSVFGPAANLSGKSVEIEVEYLAGSTASFPIDWTDTAPFSIASWAAGESRSFIARHSASPAEGSFVDIQNNSGAPARFRVPVVRELPGNHASQSTTASKFTLQSGYASFDRFDDYLTAAAGGGGTTGILLCAGIRAGGAGSARTIWSDRGTNTGYRLSVNASNQLVLSAGNGAAHTEVVGPTITAGTDYVVMGWHDGTNLNVRAGLAAATSAAFGTATAGTAGFTIGRDNGAAAGLYGDRIYGLVYRKNDASTAAQRDNVTRYMAAKSGVTL